MLVVYIRVGVFMHAGLLHAWWLFMCKLVVRKGMDEKAAIGK